MKIPYSWLREFVPVTAEPRRLGDDLTRVGLALEGLEVHDGEAVLDLDVTTNRVDCMNVYGVAREVAALYELPLAPLEAGVAESGPPGGEALDVVIEAFDLCGRFCARVLDVRMGPSPAWLRDRLELVGIRAISNVVDLTNYVMVEMGQPSHAFDLAKVPGAALTVRWGREGERVATLDGQERTVTARVGVIAGKGGQPPLALAGIMGGASSEVSEDTRTVALEAAWWEPLAVRRGARALGLHTEASHRFERGADWEAGPQAIARLAQLLSKIGAGTARPGLVERTSGLRPRRRVALRGRRVDGLLGIEVPRPRAFAILRALGFGIEPQGTDGASVEVPSWRGDVAGEADLVEEVGRHFGLGRIPSAVPPASRIGGLRLSQTRERRARDVLVGLGLTEVVNYPFVAGSAFEGAPGGPVGVRLANPLTEEQGTLRTSLLVPGLIGTLAANQRLGRRDVAVFEMGRVFVPGPEGVREENRLAVLATGPAQPPHWSAPPRVFDLFDLEGVLEVLGRRLGTGPLEVDREAAAPPLLHPGRSTALRLGGRLVGFVGALHPDVRQRFELREEALAAEVDLGMLFASVQGPVRFVALDRFPAVARDLSVVCAEATPAAEVEARVRGAAGPRLRSVSLVDRYTGSPLPPGRVSLTLSLRYQDASRTLTGEEVQASVETVMRELRAAGLEIRGE